MGVMTVHARWLLFIPSSLVAAESTLDTYYSSHCLQSLIPTLREIQPVELCLALDKCHNARAPVAQFTRAADWHSEDPGSSPGWISMENRLLIRTHNIQLALTEA